MELSLFLAKALGLYTVIICLAALMWRGRMDTAMRQFEQSKEMFGFLAGAIALMVGLLVVLSHNVWEPNWRGLVTLFGWISILKGILRLFFVDSTMRFSKKLLASNMYVPVMVFFLLIGLYLTYVGFTGTL